VGYRFLPIGAAPNYTCALNGSVRVQKSFPLTEEEYQSQLDAVAEYLTLWGVAPMVRAAIKSSTSRGPGYTGGGGARAVGISVFSFSPSSSEKKRGGGRSCFSEHLRGL
jgi:Domain of unknown function (DUF3067)